MGKIIQLDEHTTNLIAAGEVIERASSVVKELVENAIDAQATIITISLMESGIKEISVSDNGVGMSMEDARLCVLPHTTSKISGEKDLFRITTLGFRGEALASIVAVSNFMLKTSSDGIKGIMYSLNAGKIISEAIIAQPRGTEIKVKNLFYNTPARLQNLKAPNVELSYIMDFVTRISLANPNISFKLLNNNNVIFQTYGNGELLETISSIYGLETAKHMIDFDDSDGYFKVKGYTSYPDLTRSSKNFITLIINGRVVRNNNLTNAIVNSYRDRLMVGRYPITIMQIDCDFALVDVNVHPAKAEVRFSNEETLVTLITNAITYAIKKIDYIVGAEKKEETPEVRMPEQKEEAPEVKVTEQVTRITEPETNNYKIEEIKEIKSDYDDFVYDDLFTDDEPVTETLNEPSYEEKKEEIEEEHYEEQNFSFNDKQEIITESDHPLLPKLYYIGQLLGTYILTQNEEGFFIIDQHAAAERINYEKIEKELEKDHILTYELLVPIKLSFTSSEALLVRENLHQFEKYGFVIEEFGSGSFVARQIPVWVFKGRERDFVEEIINHVIHKSKLTKAEFLDSAAKSMACKKSIKANHYLSTAQVEYLLDDLGRCENPYNCPHGRPVIVKFTKEEIEKWFKRIV